MPKYNICIGRNVCAYGSVVIEAKTRRAAERQALRNATTIAFKPQWDLGDEDYRVVDTQRVVEPLEERVKAKTRVLSKSLLAMRRKG